MSLYALFLCRLSATRYAVTAATFSMFARGSRRFTAALIDFRALLREPIVEDFNWLCMAMQ